MDSAFVVFPGRPIQAEERYNVGNSVARCLLPSGCAPGSVGVHPFEDPEPPRRRRKVHQILFVTAKAEVAQNVSVVRLDRVFGGDPVQEVVLYQPRVAFLQPQDFFKRAHLKRFGRPQALDAVSVEPFHVFHIVRWRIPMCAPQQVSFRSFAVESDGDFDR